MVLTSHPQRQGASGEHNALARHEMHNESEHGTEENSPSVDPGVGSTHQEAEGNHGEGEDHVHESQSKILPGSDSSEQESRKTSEKPSYCSHLVLDTWSSEILAIGFSLACFVAIVAVLSSFDGKQSPQLSYGLTLNTIVSILATACKSSLLFLVAESIGQLKWVWFFQQRKDTKRPLQDIQSFDGASRGPLGSLTILFEHKGLSLASLGATITLLSLAFDPFIQQIIDYPLEETTKNSDRAVAKQAVWFNTGNDKVSASQVRNTVNTGIWTDNFDVNPVCPSGNCTWPSFESVGWCSQCEDVTGSAVLVGCDNAPINTTDDTTQHASCNITLPLGKPGVLPMTVNPKVYGTESHIPGHIIWTVNDRVSRDRPSYVGLENPYYVVAHAELALTEDIMRGTSLGPKPLRILGVKKATQCALTPCSRTYNVSVFNGATRVHTSAPNFGEVFFQPPEYDCWKKDKGTPVNMTHPRYGEYADTAAMASCEFGILRYYGFPKQLSGLAYYSLDYYYAYHTYSTNENGDPQANTDNVQQVISTGLDQVTNKVASSLTKLTLERSNTTVTGTISNTRTFVAVKWQWITLPAAVVLLSIVFLITTILVGSCQKRLALWKSSVLPLLYHGLDKKVGVPDGDEYATVSGMEVDAKSVEVRLEESERGRLMFR